MIALARPQIRTSSKRMEEFELRGLEKIRVMMSKRKKWKDTST